MPPDWSNFNASTLIEWKCWLISQARVTPDWCSQNASVLVEPEASGLVKPELIWIGQCPLIDQGMVKLECGVILVGCPINSLPHFQISNRQTDIQEQLLGMLAHPKNMELLVCIEVVVVLKMLVVMSLWYWTCLYRSCGSIENASSYVVMILSMFGVWSVCLAYVIVLNFFCMSSAQYWIIL